MVGGLGLCLLGIRLRPPSDPFLETDHGLEALHTWHGWMAGLTDLDSWRWIWSAGGTYACLSLPLPGDLLHCLEDIACTKCLSDMHSSRKTREGMAGMYGMHGPTWHMVPQFCMRHACLPTWSLLGWGRGGGGEGTTARHLCEMA